MAKDDKPEPTPATASPIAPTSSNWPNGESQSVHDAADKKKR